MTSVLWLQQGIALHQNWDKGFSDPQKNLAVPSLMPKYIISDRKSSRRSLIHFNIYILITCLKLQDLENKTENPLKPGPQEIFCMSFSEACRKTTRIAFPQGILKPQLLVGLEKGRGKRKWKSSGEMFTRLLKTLWKPLSGFGWKMETRAASGNEGD